MTICDNTASVPDSDIRIVGCDNGDVFHLLGEGAGAEGVKVRENGLAGLIEAQVKTLVRTPVRMDGAILRSVKTQVMTVELKVMVNAHWVNDTFAEVDGALREAFSFEPDQWYGDTSPARIEWDVAGETRWLDVYMSEGQTYEVERDPNRRGWWIWTIRLIAYVPFWQAKPVVRPLFFAAPGSKTIDIANPTGVPMYQRWSGTVAQWELPDNSWEGRRWRRAPGGRFPNRRILYPPLTALNGGIVVDYRPGELPVRDKNDTNLIATMPVPGSYPRFWVPPFTQKQDVTVTAVQVPPGGAAIKLIQPRQYRRPWGRV